MDPLTLGLGVAALLLLGANAFVSSLPKKNQARVTFIPPSTAPLVSPNVDSKLEAHMQSTAYKINALFERVDRLEKAVAILTAPHPPLRDETWIATVPARKRKKT